MLVLGDCWFWEKTAPMPVSEASHSMVNGTVKFEIAKTEVESMGFFRAEKT